VKPSKTIFGVLLALALAWPAAAQTIPSNVGSAASNMPPILANVGFEPQLNAQLPLDLPFRDETGRDVHFGDYFGAKPVVLAFVYYTCPMLCDQVQQGVVGTLRMLSFNPGRDYEVVFVSFDQRDTPITAAEKKKTVLSHFRRPETAGGWHFLSGAESSITALTRAANFRYTFDQKNNLFAHASGMLLVTSGGRISRYFYGVEFPGRDVRLGLVDASAGKIGTPIDHALLYCYHYDPTTARYSATILKLIQLGGIVTLVVLGGAILLFRRRDRRAAQANSGQGLGGLAERGAH
jgi:protein SCO1